MLAQDLPQWVEQSFIRSAQGAGATADRDELAACCEQLLTLWCAEGRYHHDVRHLLDMLARIDTLAPETPHADLVRLAAWFHGIIFSTSDLAVYTRNGGEDEAESAKVAHEVLTKLGVPEKPVHVVVKMILGLKGKRETAAQKRKESSDSIRETTTIEMIDMDQLALRDAHLGSLAVAPQKYAKYIDELRSEYAQIPEAHFLYARIAIVTKLLARKRLYSSPLAQAWESPARENLEAELERLKAKLEKLDEVPVPEKKKILSSVDPSVDTAELFELSERDADTAEPEDREQLAAQDLAMADVPATIEPQLSSLEKLDDIYYPPVTVKKATPSAPIQAPSAPVADSEIDDE